MVIDAAFEIAREAGAENINARLRADTELKNFPLYCPKCRQESLINAKDLQVTVIKEPDGRADNTQIKMRLSALLFFLG